MIIKGSSKKAMNHPLKLDQRPSTLR